MVIKIHSSLRGLSAKAKCIEICQRCSLVLRCYIFTVLPSIFIPRRAEAFDDVIPSLLTGLAVLHCASSLLINGVVVEYLCTPVMMMAD